MAALPCAARLSLASGDGDFGSSLTLNGTTLTSHGIRDAFVLKLDADGKELWQRAIDIEGGEWTSDLTTGGESLFLAGWSGATSGVQETPVQHGYYLRKLAP